MNKKPYLQIGDEIRVVAPSFSWKPNRQTQYMRSVERLQKLGYEVTFGKNIKKAGRLGTARVSERLSDLHEAYADKNIKAILCVTGGWSANELLPGIDWELIRRNPKPLIGFSDITVLHNAIFAKTGTIGLLGPNLGSLGRFHWQYSLENLQTVLSETSELRLRKSKKWSPDDKKLQKTRPWKVLQKGKVTGILIGGNIGTYYLLQGTQYAPSFTNSIILAIEDDDEAGKFTAREFDRRLESILQQPGAQQAIRGVLVGRFQPSSRVTMSDLKDIVTRKFSKEIPIVADMDFGHSKPLLTMPIGGQISIDADSNVAVIKLIEY